MSEPGPLSDLRKSYELGTLEDEEAALDLPERLRPVIRVVVPCFFVVEDHAASARVRALRRRAGRAGYG